MTGRTPQYRERPSSAVLGVASPFFFATVPMLFRSCSAFPQTLTVAASRFFVQGGEPEGCRTSGAGRTGRSVRAKFGHALWL